VKRILLAVAAGIALAACGDDEVARDRVVSVSAAASLREVLQELEASYESEHPDTDVRLNLGASGALRRQIEQGAPVDVFIAAAEAPMEALVQAGMMDGRSRRPLAGNELVLIVPAGSNLPVTGLADLRNPAVRRVALGAPASVPAGAYADEALRASGLAEPLKGRTVLAQDARQVLAFVASGNADAGIVYRTDAAVSEAVRVAATIHPTLHRRITYPLAVASHPVDPERARAFAAYLLGAQGKDALRRHGFRVE